MSKKKQINKAIISQKLVNQLSIPVKDIKGLIERVFDQIAEEVSRGNIVQIVGFGKFTLRHRKARVGRDPNSGKSIKLPESMTVAFIPSKNFSKKIKDLQ